MERRKRRAAAALAVCLGAAGAFGPAGEGEAAPKRARDLKEIKLGEVTLQRPKPQRVELPNGMVVYLLENHRLPLVNVAARIRTGSLYEPAEQAGVAQATGILLRTGGTARLTPDELDEKFDFLAARSSTGIGADMGTASLDVPSGNFEEALGLFAEMLRQPGFDADQLEVARNQVKEGIRRQNDNPIQIAIREFFKLLYGADHPAARTPTFASVDRLQRDQLKAFHARYYHPNNMLLAVAGDFDRSQIEARLARAFGGWERKEVILPPIPQITVGDAPGVWFARKDVPQSTILVGHLSMTVRDPDHVALEMVNDVLGGGGFSSRIVETIRNDRGLAYFAGSFFQPGTTMPGAFLGISLTQADSTTVALDLLLKEIRGIREGEMGAAELATAKNQRLKSEVFEYDSPEEIVDRVLYLEYFGLPADYLERSLEEVKSLDTARALAVAARGLHPDRLKILVVGNPDTWSPPLSQFGDPVREIAIADPTAEGS